MILQQVLLYFIPSLLIFVFSILALTAAFSKAIQHLVWLLPMTVGWGLKFVAYLFGLIFFYSMHHNPVYNYPIYWASMVSQVVGMLGTVCLLGSIMALFMRLQTLGSNLPSA